MARYRDRKISKTFTLVGTDVYADGSARGQAKSAYEPGSNIVNNWDVVEGCLDYIFHKLGVDAAADGGIGRPVVMTEPVVNLPYARKSGCWLHHELPTKQPLARTLELSSTDLVAQR